MSLANCENKDLSPKTFESSKQSNRMNAIICLALKIKETGAPRSLCVCACVRAYVTALTT